MGELYLSIDGTYQILNSHIINKNGRTWVKCLKGQHFFFFFGWEGTSFIQHLPVKLLTLSFSKKKKKITNLN